MKQFCKSFCNNNWFLELSNQFESFNIIIQFKDIELFWFRIGFIGKYVDLIIWNKHRCLYKWK